MPAACRAASAAHMRRGVERQPRLSSHPCHARRRAPCAPVGALAVLHQPARRGAMHPGHCVGRQPACLSTEQERMLRTLAQHQLASNQALSPLHSRPRAPAAALLNAQAQEPPLVVAALCSAACEQRSARQTRGTPGRLWDGGPPSECEPHRRPCLPQPRASGAKRQRRACFSVTVRLWYDGPSLHLLRACHVRFLCFVFVCVQGSCDARCTGSARSFRSFLPPFLSKYLCADGLARLASVWRRGGIVV